MSSHQREFTLRGYLDVLRRHKWLVLAATVICAVAALGFSLATKKSYSATSSLAVSDPNQGLSLLGGSYISGQTPLQLSAIAEPQVTRLPVVLAVKQSLHSPLTVNQLRNAVAVAIDPNSYVLDLTATSHNAATAAAIANAFATQDALLTNTQTRAQYLKQAATVKAQLKHMPPFSTQAATTATTLSRLQYIATSAAPLSVASTANVPGSPSSPKTLRNTIAALVFGLLLGIALATARDALDRRLRHSRDVVKVLDHPVVGHIRSEALGRVGIPTHSAPDQLGLLEEPDQESFRILRQNTSYLAASDKPRVVLVTSAIAEEGKSTVAACLAVAMAEAGMRTLLVECDLRRPVFAKRFGTREAPGLADYLTGNAEPHEILQPVGAIEDRRNGDAETAVGNGASNLVCITSGTSVPRPAELLSSERFRTFLAEVRGVYDAVILDTPPLLPVADTLSLIPDVSTVLICVRLEKTTRDQARAAQAALDRMPKRPVGLVLTDVNQQEDGYYYGDYGAPAATA